MTLLKRLSKADAVAQGLDYYFDKEAAARPVRFFETFLHHSKGKWAGQPFKLLEWQKVDIVEELFGWLRVKDDLRRYRLAYIEVPKKNGVLALAAW
jgi:phage terminase large subunit-like protein